MKIISLPLLTLRTNAQPPVGKVTEAIFYFNSDTGKIMASLGGADYVVFGEGSSSGGGLGPDTVGTVELKSNAVTNEKIRQSVGLSIIGRALNSVGNVADIVSSADGHILRRSGGVLGFGLVPQSSVVNLTSDLDLRAVGAFSSTDNAIVRFDGSSGKILQNSVVAISDLGQITGLAEPTASDHAASKNYVDGAASAVVSTLNGDRGDVVVSGGGLTWTIDSNAIDSGKILNGAIINSKIRDAAGLSVLGRGALTSGAVADITASTDGDILRVAGGVLGFGVIAQSSVFGLSTSLNSKVDGLVSSVDNQILRFDGVGGKTIQGSAVSISDTGVVSGVATPLLGTDAANKNYIDNTLNGDKGDVVISGGVWSIDANVVTDSKLRDSVGISVIGRSAATSGDPADIVAGADGVILRRAAGLLGFGTIPQSSVDNLSTDLAAKMSGLPSSVDNVVLRFDGTTGKLVQGSTVSISDVGVVSGLGAPVLGTDATNKNYVDSLVLSSSLPDGDKGDITVSGSGLTWTIDANVVSDSKIRTSAGLSVLGRGSNTSGNIADIVSSVDGYVLRQSDTNLGFGFLGESSVSGLSTKLSDGDKGDVVVSSGFTSWIVEAGAISTTKLANSAVTFAKMQDISNQRLLGRFSASTGAVEQISLGGSLTLTALGALQRTAITGDVSVPLDSNTSTIGNNVVTNAKIRTSAGLSVLGNATATTGNIADITGTNGQILKIASNTLFFGAIADTDLSNNIISNAKFRQSVGLSVVGRGSSVTGDVADIVAASGGSAVLRESGGVLGFGTVATAGIANSAVTFAKMQTISTDKLLGRDTALSGSVEEISLNSTLEFSGTGSIQRAALTGDITAPAGSNTTAIANNIVTNAKLSAVASGTFKARATAGAGNVEDLTATQATALLDVFNSTTKGLVPLSGGGTSNFLRADGTFAVPPTIIANGDYGDITVSAAGATWTIDEQAVTDSKLRNSAALSVLGRSANFSGVVADISTTSSSDEVLRESSGVLGFGLIENANITAGTITGAKVATGTITNSNLSDMSGGTIKGRPTAFGTGQPFDLSATDVTSMLDVFSPTLKGLTPASGGGTSTFLRADGVFAASISDGDKGDVTVSATNTVWTIDNDVVTNAKLRNSAGLSVIGRSAATIGDPADISASTSGHVLRLSGATLEFGTIPESSVDNLVSDLSARVVGPVSATDNGIVRFDGTTGKLVQDSLATIADGGSFRGVDGGVDGPTYSFTNDTNLGWFKVANNFIGLGANGSTIGVWGTGTDSVSGLSLTQLTGPSIINLVGSDADYGNRYGWSTDTNTFITNFGNDTIRMLAGGVTTFNTEYNGTSVITKFGGNSSTVPSITFVSDPDTGLGVATATPNELLAFSNGVVRTRTTPNGITLTSNAVSTNPSMNWSVQNTSGFNMVATNAIDGIIANEIKTKINAVGLQVTDSSGAADATGNAQIRQAAPTVATYSFHNASTTGFRYNSSYGYDGITALYANRGITTVSTTVNTTSATATPILTIPNPTNSTVKMIFFKVLAKRTNNINEVNAYFGSIRVKRNAGVVTSTLSLTSASEELTACNLTATTSGTDTLLNVVGIAANNITWNCWAEILEN